VSFCVVCMITMQVYMMTWVERKMAAALFAVPPSATVDEALSHFMEVFSSSSSYFNIAVFVTSQVFEQWWFGLVVVR